MPTDYTPPTPDPNFWKAEPGDLLLAREGFDLRDVDPASRPGIEAKKKAGLYELLANEHEFADLQAKLYAGSWNGRKERVLVVIQAMDAAGKGGVVNHVFGGLLPYGLSLTAFKAPTEEELQHDFLWRVEPHVPAPGVIGLFDRSHYEDVLIQRVRGFAPPEEIERRYGAICDFERRIADDGVRIIKIMLHISPEAQLERLERRLDEPEKRWKYNPSDTNERSKWAEYMEAFQIAIERTNAPHAPWYVVPADAKWYARLAVQRIVMQELRSFGFDWPGHDFDVEAERARLEQTRGLSWP